MAAWRRKKVRRTNRPTADSSLNSSSENAAGSRASRHRGTRAQRMAALLRAAGALECAACSRRDSRHSTIRASAVKALPASPRCAANSSGAGSTDLSCRAPTGSRTNTCRRVKSGSPGSPALPVRRAPPSCSRTAPYCSSMAATPYRRQLRSMPRFFPSRIWSTTRPIGGSSKISKTAPRSATIRGCTPPTTPSG